MTTPANPDDLIAFLHQQLENQRFRAGALKTLAHAMPAPETGAYLTETADLLLADVDAKRRILGLHHPYQEGYRYLDPDTRVPNIKCSVCHDIPADVDYDNPPYAVEFPCPTVRLLALPHAGRDGYREDWRP